MGPTVRDLLDPRVRDLVAEKPTKGAHEHVGHQPIAAKGKTAKGSRG